MSSFPLSARRRPDSKIQRVRLSVLRVRAQQRRTGNATLTPFLALSPPRTAGVVYTCPRFLRTRPHRASRRKSPRSNPLQHDKTLLRRLPLLLTNLSDGRSHRLSVSKQSSTSRRGTALLLYLEVVGRYRPPWTVSACNFSGRASSSLESTDEARN